MRERERERERWEKNHTLIRFFLPQGPLFFVIIRLFWDVWQWLLIFSLFMISFQLGIFALARRVCGQILIYLLFFFITKFYCESKIDDNRITNDSFIVNATQRFIVLYPSFYFYLFNVLLFF
jgi:hypothetical protein